MKRKLLWTALALASVSGTTQAVLFDPDGAGSLAPINIGGIDWTPTTFLAINGNQAVLNFISSGGACPNSSCTFTVMTQAAVAGFTDSGGSALPSPVGLNSTFEITMVASFTETVTGFAAVPGQAIAAFTTAGTPTNVEFFYDATKDSNPLTGFGYNDGNFILDGTSITIANGTFSVNLDKTGGVTPVNLDQSPNLNQYTDGTTSQLTVTGQGITGNVDVGGLTVDPLFFVTPLTALGYTFTNISQNLPFTTVDPGDCFQGGVQTSLAAIGSGGVRTSSCDNVHNAGPYSDNQIVPAGTVAPNTGLINGFPLGGAESGPDFVASTDFNSTLTGTTPEPASLALLGISLGALGLASRRRKVRPV